MVSLKDELARVRRVWDAGMGKDQVGAPQGRRRSRRNGPGGPVLPPPQGAGALRGARPAAGWDRWRALPYYCGIL